MEFPPTSFDDRSDPGFSECEDCFFDEDWLPELSMTTDVSIKGMRNFYEICILIVSGDCRFEGEESILCPMLTGFILFMDDSIDSQELVSFTLGMTRLTNLVHQSPLS